MNQLRERQVIGALLYLPGRLRRRFQEYIASPYFRIAEDIQVLCEGLEEHFFNSKKGLKLSEEDFWNRVFEEEFDQNRFTHLMFRLGEQLEEFLALEQFQQRSGRREGFAQREMLTWRMEKLYEKKARKRRKNIRKQTAFAWSDYLERFDFLLMDAAYLIGEGQHPSAAEQLEFLLLQLDDFNELSRLKIFTSVLDWELLTGRSQLPIPDYPVLPDQLPDAVTLNDLYSGWLKVLVEEKEGNYEAATQGYTAFRKAFGKIEKQLGELEFDELSTYALNFTVRQRIHPVSYIALDTEFNFWTEKRIARYLKRGQVDWREVLNYGTYLLLHGRSDEAGAMVKKTKGKIVGDPDEHVREYILGLSSYYQGDFTVALRHFNRIFGQCGELLDLDLMVRLMRLRTFFELKDWAGCLGDAESFRLKVIRSQRFMADARYRAHLNFIRFVKRTVLLLDAPNPSARKLTKLTDEVRREPALSKTWLLDQLEGLA